RRCDRSARDHVLRPPADHRDLPDRDHLSAGGDSVFPPLLSVEPSRGPARERAEGLAMIEFLSVYAEHWDAWWPQILPAVGVTLALTAGAYALSVVLGLLLAMGKLSRVRPLRWFATAYVEVARSVPALAILFLVYFGLVPLGITLDAFTAGVVGLALCHGGYMAEVFRGGLE